MNLRFESMTAETAADAAALEQICFSDPWSKESFLEEIDNPLSVWLVVYDADAGCIAAFGGIHALFDEGEILNIAVSPEYRRRGIGQELLTRLMEAVPAAESIFLEVRASNEGAIALYERMGYRTIAVRRGYYSHPTEDARIMKWERKP